MKHRQYQNYAVLIINLSKFNALTHCFSVFYTEFEHISAFCVAA